jgi:hypothetical protein
MSFGGIMKKSVALVSFFLHARRCIDRFGRGRRSTRDARHLTCIHCGDDR